ncbi:BrnT family toxin [Actinobacillus porcinus]|uniref:BrnT family toxin n=1 Tax=Actinobacillus porcinus TaxID=51048 RepID=UPI002A913F9C|nr:BrnT family toxin [Actinobacillus porcinus]MDY5420892.1 BrnT family toxin [Actinobacillus porcinus]
MKIEFDPVKNQRNIEERSLSFESAVDFDWANTLVWQDCRFDYGEPRFNALSYLNNRVHFLTFKPLADGIRVISFRKANKREIKHYESHRRS